MSDQEVIDILARREEMVDLSRCLISIDALRPVLEKLNYEQWGKLALSLLTLRPPLPSFSEEYKFLFTLPPETLARAIAEALTSAPPK